MYSKYFAKISLKVTFPNSHKTILNSVLSKGRGSKPLQQSIIFILPPFHSEFGPGVVAHMILL